MLLVLIIFGLIFLWVDYINFKNTVTRKLTKADKDIVKLNAKMKEVELKQLIRNWAKPSEFIKFFKEESDERKARN